MITPCLIVVLIMQVYIFCISFYRRVYWSLDIIILSSLSYPLLITVLIFHPHTESYLVEVHFPSKRPGYVALSMIATGTSSMSLPLNSNRL